MSSARDEFRHDSEKAPKELEREIDATRAHMERTLDMLERKLSPGELIDEVLRITRRDGGGFVRNLSNQVQNNPLPTLLTSVGLLWLYSASDRPPPPPRRGSAAHRSGGAGEAVQGAMHGARDAAGNMAQRTREGAHNLGERAHELGERAHEMGRRASEAVSHAGDYLHDMADSAGEQAGRLRDSARSAGRRTRSEYQHLLHEQPLLLGGLGLALGAAIGAMFPRTEAEDELMGEYSDRVKREAQEEGRQQYERIRDTTERVADAARQEVTDEQTSAHNGGGPH